MNQNPWMKSEHYQNEHTDSRLTEFLNSGLIFLIWWCPLCVVLHAGLWRSTCASLFEEEKFRRGCEEAASAGLVFCCHFWLAGSSWKVFRLKHNCLCSLLFRCLSGKASSKTGKACGQALGNTGSWYGFLLIWFMLGEVLLRKVTQMFVETKLFLFAPRNKA